MYTLRSLTVNDVEVLTHHRKQMFLDMGRADDAQMAEMLDAFRPWVRSRIATGLYGGFLAESGGEVVAGLGLMFQDYAPRIGDVGCAKGYILNVYVEPPHRRRGVARRLVERALEECRARGMKRVTLHYSDMGKSVYESLGFGPGREMVWRAG